ncbi:MAG: AbrB/MazE/SpoVT family DNA-binding domain-containing protein [Clostridiaceae bacterium]|nr:AbrB/MazE/SpoVT family DNA-binding domain-containing protein [Clostridiaceae bacterium]
MKATGIVRRIDDLGRVVIPKEIRRTLRIREGDSLEIYTSREGEIILKKYSPVAELGDLAKQYVDSLAQTSGGIVAVTDKDQLIAVSAGGKKELYQKPISKELEKIIEDRENVAASEDSKEYVEISNEARKFSYEIIYPIIVEGDVVGSVILLSKDENSKFDNSDETLIAFGANILGKQMEQ